MKIFDLGLRLLLAGMKKMMLAAALLSFCGGALAQTLCVGTYNLRNNRNDSDPKHGNAWTTRFPYAAAQIAYEGPAIFGTQELYADQIADLLGALPGYASIGAGRDDGKQEGEHSAIFYDTSRLQLLDNGDFWISETPDKPGLGWDAACPRICSWGKFRDLESGKEIAFFNLHMDHVGVEARREGAKLVLAKMGKIANGIPAILTGDFNVDQHDEIYTILAVGGLLDCYENSAVKFAPNGTFNDFKTDRVTDSRIDHIFVTPHFKTDKYAILTNTYWTDRERIPSDHYPVFAHISPQGGYIDQRPADRLFASPAVEEEISRATSLLANEKLAWMFANCYPNTLDTTVHFRYDENGEPETFVYTGDIHAMWLRDSGAQVWPYVRLASRDPQLQKLIKGVIRQQFKLICIDPYANAFNDGPTGGEWAGDMTQMDPNVHERKWEIDSHCYPIRLAYEYWKATGDASVFDKQWLLAIEKTLNTFAEQQRKQGPGPYRFQRKTERQFDTLSNNGLGAPVNPVGLIASSFRPSDDATTFQFLVPSNFFAVTSLRKAAEILAEVNKNKKLAKRCRELADEVEAALREHAVYDHPVYGKIYAYEVDGFGNHMLMDDANVPSLLAMPYLGDVASTDTIYQNTRRFVWSDSNPYFFSGKAGEGIGGPHVGYGYAWPMSIMMRAFTSDDDQEIAECLRMLMDTDAGTGFMHESFNVDDASDFTREWFAWQNTLFGELILHLIDKGKLSLLNSL